MLSVWRGRRKLIDEMNLQVVAWLKLKTHTAVFRGSSRSRRASVTHSVLAIADFINPCCRREFVQFDLLRPGDDLNVEQVVGTCEDRGVFEFRRGDGEGRCGYET